MSAPAANRAADSHEIRPLTGIRGFAALAVVLYHFQAAWVQLVPDLRRVSHLAGNGYLGVDLFFVLSGFILSYVYRAGDSGLGFREYRSFVWNRFARVYPNHLATLVLLMLMVLGAGVAHVRLAGDYPWSRIPFNLTMTHAWPWLDRGYWNYPSWSISAEWFAYLAIFPISWHLLRRPASAASFFVSAYAILLGWLALAALFPLGRWESVLQVSTEFLAGSLLFGASWRHPALARACHAATTPVFALFVAVMLLAPPAAWYTRPAITLLVPPLLIGLTSENSLIGRLFSTGPALWLGRVSYAIYMSHAIAQKFVKIGLPVERFAPASPGLRVAVLAGHVVVIFLLATALYYLVEVPSRSGLRRLARRWNG